MILRATDNSNSMLQNVSIESKQSIDNYKDLITSLSSNPNLRGSQFEVLTKWLLENDPRYVSQLKKVWQWDEWPEKWGPDCGIDLVAETHKGELWAIQCKAYDPKYYIKKSDVDSFLTESSRSCFSFRLLVSTTDNLGITARKTIAAQEKQVGLLLGEELRTAPVSWPENLDELSSSKLQAIEKFEPREHQIKAIDDVVKGFSEYDRGKLVMACGTGKTLTSLWISEKLGSDFTVVLVPSLSLMNQTIEAWCTHANRSIEFLAVCSDSSVVDQGRTYAEDSIGLPVVKDIQEIKKFIYQEKKADHRAIFCTYQSSDKLSRACIETNIIPDLLISDEAHRCTGNNESYYSNSTDENCLPAGKRLFMTATPRYISESLRDVARERGYELISMDDKDQFGPTFHNLSFKSAIERGLLADYRIVVMGVTEEEVARWVSDNDLISLENGATIDAKTLAAQIGLLKAIDEYGLSKIITFHSTINNARRFTNVHSRDSITEIARLSDSYGYKNTSFWTTHINGQTPAGKRTALLGKLNKLDSNEVGIVSNCSCLGEGVDVPALDGIVFVNPRSSMVDIVQAVGRAIRKAPGKDVGTIVVPVLVRPDQDPEEALKGSDFAAVWKVLQAMGAHDDAISQTINCIITQKRRLAYVAHSTQSNSVYMDRVILNLPPDVLPRFEQSFHLRALKRLNCFRKKEDLTIEQILEWIKSYRDENNCFPSKGSGAIKKTNGETWSGINAALRSGSRGLKKGSSLAHLKKQFFGVISHLERRSLSIVEILDWACEHKKRTGVWPRRDSGIITASGEEKERWSAIDTALKAGLRGLAGKDSLVKLLDRNFSAPNKRNKKVLTENLILKWADEHMTKTGKWPSADSGKIGLHSAFITWGTVNSYLVKGYRGLAGGSSLADLLLRKRNVRKYTSLHRFDLRTISMWIENFYEKYGRWPSAESGTIKESNNTTWRAVDAALTVGCRGLTGGSSLANYIKEVFDVRKKTKKREIKITDIHLYVQSYHKEHSKWPSSLSGNVKNTDLTWSIIDSALRRGNRGLKGGSSLAIFLNQYYRGTLKSTKYTDNNAI